jgi:hypothetical protein
MESKAVLLRPGTPKPQDPLAARRGTRLTPQVIYSYTFSKINGLLFSLIQTH